jgi:ElaB/YqjD/DUF883 family membrane-anchored ribosome-binding protein
MEKFVPQKAHRPLWACIAIGAALGLLYQGFQLLTVPQLHCVAKLVASPVFGAFKPEDDGVSDFSTVTTFAATLVETLESAEIQRRARERVRALNPELAEPDVRINAAQFKGSAIFNVVASGTDGIYVRTYLNALLDEFIAFQHVIRSQHQARFFKRLFDEFEEKRAASSKAVEPAEREQLEAAYKTLFERLAGYQTTVEDTSEVAIFERAGVTYSKAQDWASSLGFGAVLGMILGAVFWHLSAMATSLRSLLSET